MKTAVFPLVGVPPPTNPLAQTQTASPPKADRSDPRSRKRPACGCICSLF